jgi:hypothetical protein
LSVDKVVRIAFNSDDLHDTALLRRVEWSEKRYEKAKKKAVELRALVDSVFATKPEGPTHTGETAENRAAKGNNIMASFNNASRGTFSKGPAKGGFVPRPKANAETEEFGNGVVELTLRTKMALTKFFKPGPTSPLKVSGEFGRLNAKTGEVYTNSVDVKLWGEQATDFLEKGGGEPGCMVTYTCTLRREKAYQKDPQAEERWETTLHVLDFNIL